MEKPMSSSVRVNSFITYGSWGQKIRDRHYINQSYLHTAAVGSCKPAATHPDLTQLHLDLFRDDIGPILLSEKVPEYSSQEGIDPGFGLHRLL